MRRVGFVIVLAVVAASSDGLAQQSPAATQTKIAKTKLDVPDAAAQAVVDYFIGLGGDLSDHSHRQPLIAAEPPKLPPPPPPSWLRHWTIELREALQLKDVSHTIAQAPIGILRLGTTVLGARRALPARFSALRCIPADAGAVVVSLRWQGDDGGVLLGVDRRCPTTGGSTWLRMAVRCDSQGTVLWSFGLAAELKPGAKRFPLRPAPLGKGQVSQIALAGGGWLLQLDHGPAPAGTSKPARRALLAIDRHGQNGTLLFDGPIPALTQELDAARRHDERTFPNGFRRPGVALGGIWQSATLDDTTLWLQAVGRPGPRDAGLALWRHRRAGGWERQALPLPRTTAEGSWLCQRQSINLSCTFQVPPLPGVRGFRPRLLRPTPTGWREKP